jgi:hypothetical protein
MSATPGPLAVSRGNTGDHAYYVAAGRLDEKSGMTFFDRHVAWVTRKEDADLFAKAEKMAETLQWIVDCGDAGEGGRPAYHDMRAKAAALLREIHGKEVRP